MNQATRVAENGHILCSRISKFESHHRRDILWYLNDRSIDPTSDFTPKGREECTPRNLKAQYLFRRLVQRVGEHIIESPRSVIPIGGVALLSRSGLFEDHLMARYPRLENELRVDDLSMFITPRTILRGPKK